MTLPHIEQIREAYITDNFDRIQIESDRLLSWIKNDTSEFYHIGESQLSALLIMAGGDVSREKYQ